MADIILSLHPRHAQAILAGRKTVELRRAKPAKTPARVVIYETAPTMMIVGEFTVSKIIEAPPDGLWDIVGERSCVTREEFDHYFDRRKGKACERGFGIEVGKVTTYRLNPRTVDPRWTAPQSFHYLGRAMRLAIERLGSAGWMTLAEVAKRNGDTLNQTEVAAESLVPVGPEFIKTRIVDGKRVRLYSPAALKLLLRSTSPG